MIFTKPIILGFAASVGHPSPLVETNGKPTKRIVCILMVKCARGNRPTYEKELLNSRKNSHFYKTNHPAKGNNGGLGGLMEDLVSIQITISFAYMPGMTGVAGDLAMTRR